MKQLSQKTAAAGALILVSFLVIAFQNCAPFGATGPSSKLASSGTDETGGTDTGTTPGGTSPAATPPPAPSTAPTSTGPAYYVSDCQTGAVATCVPGNDANAGTTAASPWRTTAKVRTMFGSLPQGSRIYFAKGGAWTNATLDPLQNLASTAANPMLLDSYQPSWYAGAAKPILTETRVDTNMIAFTDGGSPETDAGYVVRNLELRGGGTGAWGVFTSQNVSDVYLENLTIADFGIGVHCGHGLKRIVLRNSTLLNNHSQGILWGCVDSLVENNLFDNNGYVNPPFDHSIYLGHDETEGANVTVRNNRLVRNAEQNGVCLSPPFVVHGQYRNLVIENNEVIQAKNAATGGCWGIAVDGGYGSVESFNNLVIRGNKVVNVGGLGIGVSSCVNCLIEENTIIKEDQGDLIGIAVPDRDRQPEDVVTTGATVRKNTITFPRAGRDSTGIRVSTEGTGHMVVDNKISFGAGSDNAHACFETTGLTLANFTMFDRNQCSHADGNGRYSQAYATLANAKAAGFDVNGSATAP